MTRLASLSRSISQKPAHLLWRLPLFAVALGLSLAPLLFLLSDTLAQFFFGGLILLALLYIWGRWVEGRSLADYGLRADRLMLADFLAGLAIAVASVAAIWAVSGLLGAGVDFSLHRETLDLAFLLFLTRTLLVGFWEEALFRGYLLVNLRDGLASPMGRAGATLVAVSVSSLLFALAHIGTDHFSPAAFAVLAINGAVWCVPMLITGRLGLSMGLHAAWNFAQARLFGFAMSGGDPGPSLFGGSGGGGGMAGPEVWTGGGYGPEAGLAGLFGLAVMLALVLAYLAAAGRLRPRSG